MRRIHGAAAFIAACLALSGCASQPEIPFDHTATQIKKIGIVTPSFPEQPSVVLLNSGGRAFGLLGALVGDSMQASRDSQLTTIVQQRKFSAADVFVERLTHVLRQSGYTVQVIPMKRDGSDFVAKYPAQEDTKVDAYLDVVTNAYGYIAAGTGDDKPYSPRFAVRARLVRARDSSVLMQDFVLYNPLRPTEKTVTIPADPALQFKDFDALVANPAMAVKGLRVATEQSAQTVGRLLR